MENSLADLRNLPRRDSETWELAVISMDGMQVHFDGALVTPSACLIAESRTGRGMAVEVAELGMAEHEAALAGIISLCLKKDCGYVPGAIAVRDPELAALIRGRLDGYGIAVHVSQSLAALDELIGAFKRDVLPPPAPGWLDAPGMTLRRLEA
ncbi:MAG TPA: hypothetical protein VFC46_14010, partial [Humisphaera sp.]|nr:hypothetical protein [Humisphaera sp.]